MTDERANAGAEVEPLAWVPMVDGAVKSRCGMFMVLPALDERGRDIPDVFFAVDKSVVRSRNSRESRWSPNGSAADCREWCERRATGASMEPGDALTTAIALAKSRGLMGVVVASQGGSRPYLARCINRDGMMCDPICWDTHETPDAAIADLIRQFGPR